MSGFDDNRSFLLSALVVCVHLMDDDPSLLPSPIDHTNRSMTLKNLDIESTNSVGNTILGEIKSMLMILQSKVLENEKLFLLRHQDYFI